MARKSKKARPDLLDEQELAIEREVRSTPLPVAILAAFTGNRGRRWTVGELERKLSALGFQASRRTVTLALSELETHLTQNDFLPWALVERGREWFLLPKSMVLAAIESVPGMPAGRTLSNDEKAVLLVIIGHRKKGGVSKTRLLEILPLREVDTILQALATDRLIYSDPAKSFSCWRARPRALLSLGMRSHTEISELRELELYFESRKGQQLEHVLAQAGLAEKIRLQRQMEQTRSLPSPSAEVVPQFSETSLD
jgi:hypothetical protein